MEEAGAKNVYGQEWFRYGRQLKGLKFALFFTSVVGVSVLPLYRDSYSSSANVTSNFRYDENAKNMASSARHTGKDTDILIRIPAPGEVYDPALAWLLAFPDSGAAYTTTLLSASSRYATATNDGAVVQKSPTLDVSRIVRNTYESVPVSKVHPNGPFKVHLDLELPLFTSFLLTETHSGFCRECPPNEYDITSLEHFFDKCRTANKLEKAKDTTSLMTSDKYDADRVKKAIHLIRNPFDNVVANFLNFHREQTELVSVGVSVKPHYVTTLSPDPEGFLRWCNHQDTAFTEEDREHYDPETLALLFHVPCHAEFVKYARWHNAAFQIVQASANTGLNTADGGRDIPTLVIKYEDYVYKFGLTIQAILRFLDLPHRGPLKRIDNYVSYWKFYTPEMKLYTRSLLHKLASEQTWEYLLEYMTEEKK